MSDFEDELEEEEFFDENFGSSELDDFNIEDIIYSNSEEDSSLTASSRKKLRERLRFFLPIILGLTLFFALVIFLNRIVIGTLFDRWEQSFHTFNTEVEEGDALIPLIYYDGIDRIRIELIGKGKNALLLQLQLGHSGEHPEYSEELEKFKSIILDRLRNYLASFTVSEAEYMIIHENELKEIIQYQVNLILIHALIEDVIFTEVQILKNI